MCGLMLVRPCKLYAEQVMSYKEEMSQMGIALTVVQDLKMSIHLMNGLILKED